MNVLQALLAAVQCKPIPPRRNRNNPPAGGGAGGASSRGSRNISGLSGTPSSYAGRHSTRSGQRSTISSTAAASTSLVESDSRPSDCLDTTPTLRKKRIGFTESITDGSPSCVHNSRLLPDESITRKSSLTTTIAEEIEVEKDVESCLLEESIVFVGEQVDGTNDNDATVYRDKRTGQPPSLE